jgi:hypothetical protein
MSRRHYPITTAAFLACLVCTTAALAQPLDGPPPPAEPQASGTLAEDFSGAVRVLRIPGATGSGSAEAKAAGEIFPDANKVWMHVEGTDPRPIEGARRGSRKWLCSGGCEMATGATGAPPPGSGVGTEFGRVATNPGDAMLRSIKVQTPKLPLPLLIWRPIERGPSMTQPTTVSGATTTGQLLFDPVLLGRRSYRHVCAYPPVKAAGKDGDDVPLCRNGRPQAPTPDSAEMRVGLSWPRQSEMADFQYVAITDTCGNAHVQPFQRAFTVPAFHVATGGCGKADGRVLRVFPHGGWLRVTAFNLDRPASGNVVSATFRVTVPPLEDLVSANTPPMLFPDPRIDDIVVDCGPQVLHARPVPGSALPGQSAPPGKGLPGQTAPPGKELPGQKAPPGKGLPGQKAPPGKGDAGLPSDKNAPKAAPTSPPIVRRPRALPARKITGQPMAHQGVVLGPEPLLQGNCRIEMKGQTKRRLVAPLGLRVRLSRTDVTTVQPLVDLPWIVTPTNSVFRMPPLDPSRFDGESRLRLEVYSDPLSPEGNVVLLSDAGRVSRVENIALAQPESLQRLIGSLTIHSAPLCGESNFETVDQAGSCIRGYFTVPVMLATLQVTRAPWVERPLVTRNILSAVGIAFALDSYDPVEREAFPIAMQLGGFVQDLGEDRLGLLTYLGVAPTLPVLGEGGNTTSIGVLGGLGMEYITSSTGPDEGFKPAAFLSIVVQIGQANPLQPNYAAAGPVGGYAPPY